MRHERVGRPIRRLLIANRGEIAVRIVSACRGAGIQPVAVYSEADRNALHVRLAGEAICIGAAPAAESYLNQDAMITAAKAVRADAIHPGYGFLAENADFADSCRSEGLVFVGPSAGAMRLMADKAAAKRLARQAGVPVVPGYDGEDQSDAVLSRQARRIGFPLMIKAALGGGGKGMHGVHRPRDLAAVLAQARREAAAAFGDNRLMLERLIGRPRHIEVQVLGDEHGRIVSVGERECSIQRRHQKVIEESPSPAVDAALRERLTGYALAIAQMAGYSNAGTVEFLVDESGGVYFLEMNTRIQVEHAVTEAVYGVDLVRLQIAIAAGERLQLPAGALRPRGHAIECRIYAEDPQTGFLPSTGPVLVFETPDGPGVRNDIGTFMGDEIGPDYDPLLAKLTVHAADRAGAIGRLRDALSRYTILALQTNLTFLRSVVRDPEFERGEFDVEFLDRHPQLAAEREVPPPECLFAAAAAELLRPGGAGELESLWRQIGPWRLGGHEVGLRWDCDGRRFEVSARRHADGAWTLRSEGSEFSGTIERIGACTVVLRGPQSVSAFQVVARDAVVWVARRGESWRLDRQRPPSLEHRRRTHASDGSRSLTAPMPGRVVRVEVKVQDRVRPHQVLVILEAMKMEHAIEAPTAGVVRKVHCHAGDSVRAGAGLVDLDETL